MSTPLSLSEIIAGIQTIFGEYSSFTISQESDKAVIEAVIDIFWNKYKDDPTLKFSVLITLKMLPDDRVFINIVQTFGGFLTEQSVTAENLKNSTTICTRIKNLICANFELFEEDGKTW